MKALPESQHSVRPVPWATRFVSMKKRTLYLHQEMEWKMTVKSTTAINFIRHFLNFQNILSASGNLTKWKILRQYEMTNKQTNRKLRTSG
jgi:hypothetical protein